MAKLEEKKKERSIIFIHEGSNYPCIKRGWFTDDEWAKLIFVHFALNDRDYYHINETAILVFVRKGN